MVEATSGTLKLQRRQNWTKSQYILELTISGNKAPGYEYVTITIAQPDAEVDTLNKPHMVIKLTPANADRLIKAIEAEL